jgi:hypothetical protein
MKYLAVCGLVVAVACGGGRSPAIGDGPPGQDSPHAADARPDTAIDAPIDSAGGGIDAAPIDAPADAGMTCQPPGTMNRVSIDTPALAKGQLVATTATTTLVVWGVYPDGVTLDRAAWAQLQGSTVIASGTFDAGVDPTSGKLFVLGSTYYLFSPSSGLYRFDGTTWTPLAGFTASRIIISGSHVFGLSTVSGHTKAVMFDGTTVGASTQVGSVPFVDAVGDGAGNVGILMYDAAAMSVRFVSGDGTTWSTEAIIASGPTAWQQFHVASSGTQWGVSAVRQGSATPRTWLLGASTWTAADSGLTSMAAFVGNAGTFLLVATNGQAAIYKAGAWTQSLLTIYGSADVQVAAFGPGYTVFDDGFITLFDGTSWSAPKMTNLRFASPFVVSGTRFAIAASELVIYDSGTWSNGGATGDDVLAYAGGDLVSVSMRWYPRGSVTISTNIASGMPVETQLPQYGTSGSVTHAVVARGQNGTALAIWSQYDMGVLKSFVAWYTCQRWSPGVLQAPMIHDAYRFVALGNTFLVANGSRVDVWAGASFMQSLPTGPSTMVASDGTTAVALWQAGTAIEYATTTDANTWTAAQQVDTGSLVGVTGANGSIIAWWLSGSDVVARVWHNGTWSDPRTLASVYSTSCQGSVTGPSAIVACTSTASGSPIDIELYDGTAWSTISTGSGSFVLGTDGTDYRLEYGLRSPSTMGTVLHAGSWSTPVVDPSADSALGVAGRAGTWEVISTATPSYSLAVATGAGALGANATLGPLSNAVSLPDPFMRLPGHTDAALIEANPAYRDVSELFVVLDL